MHNKQMYQISTLQALLLGYTRGFISVKELLEHGDSGLGTFHDVNGEMIILDHQAFCADSNGNITKADPTTNVPFAAISSLKKSIEFPIKAGNSIDELQQQLNIVIDYEFGLNSMYVVRMDGYFEIVKARSEKGYHSHHIELSEILKKTQKDFQFENIYGSLICMYFPDYMAGINAAGWHFHFISEDRTKGGHVYDLVFADMKAKRRQLHNIQIQLPDDKAFDTYSLKSISKEDVKKVEQSG